MTRSAMQAASAAILFALLATGCARVAPLVAVTATSADRIPLEYPRSTRERMLRILRAEWQEWGSFQIDMRNGRPPDTIRGTANEYDRDRYPALQAYWSLFAHLREDDEDAYLRLNRRLALTGEFGPRNTDELGHAPPGQTEDYCRGSYSRSDSNAWIWGCRPWSAAFISYVIVSAGVGEFEFVRSNAHRGYVDQFLRTYDAVRDLATFIPHNRLDRTPAVGDLICATRGGNDIDTWQERWAELSQPEPPTRAMHCDIVTEVNAQDVVAIGGNVHQTVAASRFRLDANRRLDTNARHFFVVFENRMGVPRPRA